MWRGNVRKAQELEVKGTQLMLKSVSGKGNEKVAFIASQEGSCEFRRCVVNRERVATNQERERDTKFWASIISHIHIRILFNFDVGIIISPSPKFL